MKYLILMKNNEFFYKFAKEFVEKGLSLLNNNGQMAMFLKIQFLEGAKRKFSFSLSISS